MLSSEESSIQAGEADPQTVIYPNNEDLQKATQELKAKPGLCNLEDTLQLKTLLKQAEQQNAFIIHSGDCAERFSSVTQQSILARVRQMQTLGETLARTLNSNIVLIGRIAGQYAKPRSSLCETKNGVTLPSYRGDLINSPLFDEKSRMPDPKRLLMGYEKAKQTIQYIEETRLKMEKPLPFFNSHEALNLPYEKALTRTVAKNSFYNASTHLPWLGMRTALFNSAHLRYLNLLENPIAVKIGPDISQKLLTHLIETLNPKNESGKLILIPRLGLESVESTLPKIIEHTKQKGYKLCWFCDPMHGNTKLLKSGVKTRYLDEIKEETRLSLQIHSTLNSHLSGLHLELTPEPVTECLESTLSSGTIDKSYYTSALDPRLNHKQALELIESIAK